MDFFFSALKYRSWANAGKGGNLRVPTSCLCECMGGCAEVDSKTEAVRGEAFVLGCISCKRREEVSAITTLDWHFKPQGEENYTHIFHYEHPTAEVLDEAFMGRLDWLGTLGEDVQAGTVAMHNISYDDAGTYRCTFTRTLLLAGFRQHVTVEKEVELSVVDVGENQLFVLLIFTFTRRLKLKFVEEKRVLR
ncbi:sodium channel subunit beta-1-like isoform X2 [Corythoichthys intestinalis]|uniref:sodium channel subunit beta-1-like isoform X2 n=1 Tax=Corythoichthys intestinalis TaxID=161448 RepID=UPI0025A4D3A4|nr:sodium channel subunit beta-1-like isoform X2 [Corythoichthys intestinalis]